MAETTEHHYALARWLRRVAVAEGLTPSDMALLASTIADAISKRDNLQRNIDNYGERPKQIETVRRHIALRELRQVNEQIAHWEAECGFRFD